MEYIKLNLNIKEMEIQNHVHDFYGYSKTSDNHYHRFLGVTGEAIPVDKNDHIHEVVFKTDYINGHYHEYIGRTAGKIVCGDRHTHYIDASTTANAGHSHGFRLLAQLADQPGN
ncbi:MAG: YmaF family protein [Lachnoclostridium sp.]|jgi:hypothetical protein